MMTFFGKPRTEAADARQRARQHLCLDDDPAHGAGGLRRRRGLGRHPDDASRSSASCSSNPFHHYIGGLAEALHIEAAELPFNAVPRWSTSLVVALGGLLLGYLVYRGLCGPRRRARRPTRWSRPLGGAVPGPAEQVLLRRAVLQGVRARARSGWPTGSSSSTTCGSSTRSSTAWARSGGGCPRSGHWFDVQHRGRAPSTASARSPARSAARCARLQTGKAQNYLFTVLLVLSIALGVFLLLPEVMLTICLIATGPSEGSLMNNLLLTIITFVPLVGALLTLLPWGKWFSLDKAREERLIKTGAIAISLLPLGLAIMLWFAYDKAAGGMQFQVERAVDPGAQRQLPHRRGWPERAVDLPDDVPDHARPVVLGTRDQDAGAGVLLPLPAARNGHAGRLYLARPGPLLRLLGDRPRPDVLPDRHLGASEGPAAVLGDQVLPLHDGRLGLHAAGHPRHLLCHRQL